MTQNTTVPLLVPSLPLLRRLLLTVDVLRQGSGVQESSEDGLSGVCLLF